MGRCSTGAEVAHLAHADWGDKFKAAFDLSNLPTKELYDDLIIMRRHLRNFVAHGAFGKDGEAFQFHSKAGAVPVLLPHKIEPSSYRFGNGLDFSPPAALDLIAKFIEHLWSGPRAPAKIYIQDHELPAILTRVKSGEYMRAMASMENMKEYADHLSQLIDSYANMDF